MFQSVSWCSPELGRDKEILTLGVTSLQGCMEAVTDGWLVEVVAGTVDVPADVSRTKIVRLVQCATLLPSVNSPRQG